LWIQHLDSQALSLAATEVKRFEFSALYTLQHGLPRNTESLRGFDHRYEPVPFFFDEACTKLRGRCGYAKEPRA